jgi:hypothetical protein
MATSSLYGTSSESTGLYGIGAASGGTYFEWFIFQDSATAPATPTGGSWSFSTNTGTAPSGWVVSPPPAPVNQVWVSIAIVDSRNTSTFVWSIPGLMTGSGLPVLTGAGVPSSGTGLNGQLYINTSTTPQSLYNKQAGAWVQLTGASIYATAGANTNITSLTGITGGISSATYVQLNTAGGGAVAPGKLQWDTTWNGPQIGLGGGNVNLQIGQEEVIYVYNQTGSTLTDGQVVYVAGSQGQRLTVGLALANGDATSATILGVVTESIANNSSGFVTVQGMVNGLNTSGFADGAVIYVSPTTPGAWTTTKPQAPQHLVQVGYVVKGGSGGAGSIYVFAQNGYELNELHDVRITSVANNNLLRYNSSVPAWVNIAGPSGTIVGTTDTQTLTNKSISGSANTLTNIPNSALVYDSVNVNGVDLTLGAVQLLGADWILPSYAGNAGKILSVNPSASDVEWRAIAGAGTVTQINTGTGLTGGPITAAGTISIANTGVTASTYGSTSKTLTATVNAQGQLTAMADANIAIANTQVTGLGTASTKDAGSALGVATLDAGGQIPLSQIPASLQGGVSYQGTWNASTNTPGLVSSVGTKGYYYVVSVAGSTSLNGITDWKVGDWAIFSGSIWEKVDNTESVTSVNGYTGAVTLSYTDVGAPSTTGTNATGTWGIAITGNAANVTGTVAIANGGTGQTTRQDAMDALAGSVTSGQYLRGNGTDVVMSAIQAADVPTLNQNTTGNAATATNATTAVNVSGGTANVTTLTASADSAFTSTGAVQLSSGTTGQRPTGAAGKLRFNTTTAEFEGYNGAAWASVGGSAISNDTSTATNLYPLFASATTGTAANVYTSNAQYLFKPSTGELSVKAPRASNGIVVNSATISSDYTIATGDNGGSFGPVAVNSGVTVTVSSGSTWTVV